MKLLLISILISSACLGQGKDSLLKAMSGSSKNNTPSTKTTSGPLTIKPDSATIVMSEFLIFLQDKVTVKDYMPIQQAVAAFLKSKEFIKP